MYILFMPSLVLASVAGDVNKANGLYSQGKYDASLDLYQKALDKDDKSPVVKYDLGTALYKKGDYDKALEYLEQAAQDKNIKIKPKAEYNLGNDLYKSGMLKVNTNVDDAIKSLQEAIGQYVQVVRDDPKDADAKFNQDIVRKEIERLKQIKQKQKRNQQPSHTEDSYKSQQNQQKPSHTEDSYKSQQNQQGQQSQQNQQEQQAQQAQQKKRQNQQAQQSKSKEQKNQKKQSAKDQAEENQKQLDRKQAEDLLEDYQENEEPKKLLNYMPKKIDDRPVLKDW